MDMFFCPFTFRVPAIASKVTLGFSMSCYIVSASPSLVAQMSQLRAQTAAGQNRCHVGASSCHCHCASFAKLSCAPSVCSFQFLIYCSVFQNGNLCNVTLALQLCMLLLERFGIARFLHYQTFLFRSTSTFLYFLDPISYVCLQSALFFVLVSATYTHSLHFLQSPDADLLLFLIFGQSFVALVPLVAPIEHYLMPQLIYHKLFFGCNQHRLPAQTGSLSSSVCRIQQHCTMGASSVLSLPSLVLSAFFFCFFWDQRVKLHYPSSVALGRRSQHFLCSCELGQCPFPYFSSCPKMHLYQYSCLVFLFWSWEREGDNVIDMFPFYNRLQFKGFGVVTFPRTTLKEY